MVTEYIASGGSHGGGAKLKVTFPQSQHVTHTAGRKSIGKTHWNLDQTLVYRQQTQLAASPAVEKNQ